MSPTPGEGRSNPENGKREVWLTCPDCGEGRWGRYNAMVTISDTSRRCSTCAKNYWNRSQVVPEGLRKGQKRGDQ